MIKQVISTLLLLALSGCYDKPHQSTNVSEGIHPTFDVVCLNGVKYYYSRYHLAPVMNSDTSKAETCFDDAMNLYFDSLDGVASSQL